ncbi:MAG: YifB family Mg chelatase-like AAA ATPase [Bacteroidales bacterium]|nr:YifB family Mg chelatase-like AAA ATPase [Bacteroidales bacterium]
MLNKCYCATCIGVEAVVVTVETDLSTGIGIHLVGLPDSAVRESLLRVVTALTSYGFRVPGRKLVVNLAPADIRKEGSAYDLAIALGLLAVSEQVQLQDCDRFVIMGELALDGHVRPVAGVLPVALQARAEGFAGCIFPTGSAREAADIEGIDIYGVSTLGEAIEVLTRREECGHLIVHARAVEVPPCRHGNDFRQVRGQQLAKRGLEIAAAGGHNIILVGAPGSGKSLMASCLPSILPPMTREEAIETGKIYSVAGRGTGISSLMRERPFRAPHHSASLVSLIGGGPKAGPGEISLAHNGVLYLDEIAQFSRSLLDALRQPIEDGRVVISRARYKVEYPSSFMLVASMNPCPCGYFGDGSGRCTCTRGAVESYLSRISGPMMDRIDLQIQVNSLSAAELLGMSAAGLPGAGEESSEAIAARVARAREIQVRRFAGEDIFTNAAMGARLLERFCPLSDKCRSILEKILDRMGLSARAYTRILKVARTIADLAGEEDILPPHLLEAAGFRFLDRRRILD